MRYLKPFIQPNEIVLYDGQVHPVIFFKGLFYLFLGALIWRYLTQLPPANSPILWGGYYLSMLFEVHFFYDQAWGLHRLVREYETAMQLLAGLLALWGIRSLLMQLVDFFFTEVVITNMRILIKRGWFNVVTEEIDRGRIAGVTIFQPFWGRILNYGNVIIQGFVQHVYGLPPLMRPYLLQQQLGVTGDYQL